jgi:tripartite-type tricarboxylate transporter receptor subunit TctC
VKIRGFGAMMGVWLIALALAGAGRAQGSFPNRPVHLVIPYSAGSVADVFGRIVTQIMAAQWNGSIVLESKSGANGSIAAEDVARAAPDGYTWLLVTTFFTTSPSLNIALRWDPVRDFIPIGQICQAPNFFIVPSSLPVKNVAEYVVLARTRPGALNYSHPGKGSTGHLGFELFKRLAGIDVTAVGYRGYPRTRRWRRCRPAPSESSPPSTTAARNIFPMCRPWRSRALPRPRSRRGSASW